MEKGECGISRKSETRKQAIELIKDDEFILTIGSPTCSTSSIVMNAYWPRMSPIEKQRILQEAGAHLTFHLDIQDTTPSGRASLA